MKILKRYTISEFIPSFLLGFFIFTFVLFVSNFFPLARIFFDERIGPETTIKLLFNIICLILPYSIAMGVLLGSVNCFNRLSQDGEVVGLESCGIGPSSVIMPVLGLTFLLSIFCLYLHAEVSPSAHLSIKQLQEDFKIEDIVASTVEEKVLMDNFKDYKIYIDKIKGKQIEGVTVFKLKETGMPSVIVAKKGEIIISEKDRQRTLKLINGTIDEADVEDPTGFTKVNFNTYQIKLEPIKGAKEVNKKPWDMKLRELEKSIKYFKKQEIIPYHLFTEMHKRYSLSFSPLFFLLFGSILGIKIKGKNKVKGFGVSLPVIIVYYIILLFCERVSQKGVYYPFILMWLPNIFLLSFCIPYFLKKEI
ncbi:MAG: LptF/LptG family permease [Candidatus Ratteibacteria bacterium]|nr:LptF/LptG family permease [Candidatus Ratteibacteria bacterium]